MPLKHTGLQVASTLYWVITWCHTCTWTHNHLLVTLAHKWNKLIEQIHLVHVPSSEKQTASSACIGWSLKNMWPSKHRNRRIEGVESLCWASFIPSPLLCLPHELLSSWCLYSEKAAFLTLLHIHVRTSVLHRPNLCYFWNLWFSRGSITGQTWPRSQWA